MASPTPNLALTYPAHGGAVNAWDTPLNTDFDTLDLVIGGTLALTGGTASFGAAVTLTQTQANNRRVEVSGVLTSNFVITFPAIGGEWIVYNNTTGSFTVTCKTNASAVTAIGVTQTLSKIINSNAVDMFDAVTSNNNTWTGATYAGSDVSPAAISTTQNDYNPTSLSTATCLRLNCTAACSITGLAGGAAGRDLELINIGTATLKFPANSVSSSAANRFANAFNLFPGQSIFLRYDATSSLWRPNNIATATSSNASAFISNDVLIINNAGTPNTQLTITASSAWLVDASGNGIKFETISEAIDSTTTGPGGCDLGTRAASTVYFIWLVSDGVVVNAVVSTSTSLATVLANLVTSAFPNYIYGVRIGSQRTNSSSNFLRIRQMGRVFQYVVSSATTTAMPSMSSGASTGSITVPTWTAVSVSSYVPSTATKISVVGQGQAAATTGIVAPNNLYGKQDSTTNPPPYLFEYGPTYGQSIGTFMLESTNIYIAANNTYALYCLGWEENF